MIRSHDAYEEGSNAPKTVDYPSLSIATQEDIAANLIDKSGYLAGEGWTEGDLRETLADLVEPIRVRLVRQSVRALRRQAVRRGYSEVVVRKLAMALAACRELDPVLVDGEEFVDGRHRVEAYARAGRRLIPAVDLGQLLRLNWEDWMNGGESQTKQ